MHWRNKACEYDYLHLLFSIFLLFYTSPEEPLCLEIFLKCSYLYKVFGKYFSSFKVIKDLRCLAKITQILRHYITSLSLNSQSRIILMQSLIEWLQINLSSALKKFIYPNHYKTFNPWACSPPEDLWHYFYYSFNQYPWVVTIIQYRLSVLNNKSEIY